MLRWKNITGLETDICMKEFEFFDVAFRELSLDRKDIYQLMGYGEHMPDMGVTSLTNRVLDEIEGLITPHCGYRVLEGKVMSNDLLTIGDVQFCPGRIITHAMKDASCYALFTVTLGSAFDRYCMQLKKEDDLLRVFIADAIGSVLAEATVTLLMDKLAATAAAEGMKISNNYSPGYCDWILTEQQKLFSLFPEQTTGIQLTDSCLMLPIKSVSGLVAIGSEVKKQPYGCSICGMITCVKNKKQRK